MPSALIAIDQGTTSTRAIAFDAALKPLASAQQELRQIYPSPGLVEHDPEEIWSATLATVRAAMQKAGLAAKDVAGIGIANQRETVVIWDRASGTRAGVIVNQGDQLLMINANGFYRFDPKVEPDIVFAVQTPTEQRMLTPAEFAAKYRWRNNPSLVKLGRI